MKNDEIYTKFKRVEIEIKIKIVQNWSEMRNIWRIFREWKKAEKKGKLRIRDN